MGGCARKKHTVKDKLRNIVEKSCKFDQIRKTVNLRIAVPPLANRASSINSVKAEGLCEEYRLTYYLFVRVLILLL